MSVLPLKADIRQVSGMSAMPQADILRGVDVTLPTGAQLSYAYNLPPTIKHHRAPERMGRRDKGQSVRARSLRGQRSPLSLRA